MASWFRNIHVSSEYSRWSSVFTQVLNPGTSLLRMWVSWHVVGDAWTVNDPLFAGVQYVHSDTRFAAPDDPMALTVNLDGDWVAAEMHAPRRDPAIGSEPYRNVWPGDGHRIWNIETNRKVDDGMYLLPYIVFALPHGTFGTMAGRAYYSILTEA